MIPSKDFLRRLISSMAGESRATGRRRDRHMALSLDTLEDRVVLSHFGGGHGTASRLAAQAALAATTSATTTTGTSSSTSLVTGSCTPGGSASQDAQLTTDRQTLQTDLNATLAGSTVTDAQRLALKTDLRAIAKAGVTVDKTALQAVTDTLLTSIAAGTYATDQATIQAAFTASFTGTSGATLTTDQAALVSTAYTDFVAVAQGLNLDTTELTTLAADRAAIAADFTRLGITTTDGHGQSSNLDLIVASNLGGGHGHRGHHS